MTSHVPGSRADRREVRRAKRAERRAVQGQARKDAEAKIVAQIRRHRVFRTARNVGTFMAFDGEPDVSALIRLSPGHRFHVPIIDERRMRFAVLGEGGRRPNFFGIAEPLRRRFLSSRLLDLVLTPLVAFDGAGMRIGVGRGYYDRCFAYLRHRRYWRRPKLLGVAFECQRVDHLAAQEWDVPLWGVVTERGLQVFD